MGIFIASNSLAVANFLAHTLYRNMYQKDPPLFLSLSPSACPEGLDWDGASCDIIIREDDVMISDDSEGSHWLIMGGRQTLVFMLLASVVVMVTSLAVRARTANRRRSLESTSELRDKINFVNSRTFRTPLVN